MAFSLLLDEDVRILLAQVLRDRGYDVVHATEVGLKGSIDPAVFHYAIEQRRAVLTHNVAHFMDLTQEFAAEDRSHFGLLLSAHLPFRDLLTRTLRVFRDRTPTDMVDAVIWI